MCQKAPCHSTITNSKNVTMIKEIPTSHEFDSAAKAQFDFAWDNTRGSRTIQ